MKEKGEKRVRGDVQPAVQNTEQDQGWSKDAMDHAEWSLALVLLEHGVMDKP